MPHWRTVPGQGHKLNEHERADFRKRLKEIYGPMCFYCRTATGTTLDHLMPRSMTGKSDITNLVLACFACNHEKSDRLPTVNERQRVKAALSTTRS